MDAAEWESNPDAYRFANGAMRAILASTKLRDARSRGAIKQEGLDVLEIGCGTGILTFRLAHYVRSIVAIDTALDMMAKFREKMAMVPRKAAKITPICHCLEDAEDPVLPRSMDGRCRRYDLIVSHLVLHHIADHVSLLRTLYGCLRPGGQIALTDFEDCGPDSRRFHPEGKMSDVEHQRGIKATEFAQLMEEAGFVNVKVGRAWTMKKQVESCPGEFGPKGVDIPQDGYVEERLFPFLLCIGSKKGTSRQRKY